MTLRIYSDTKLPGYSLAVEEDLRVLRQIERRAQEVQMELWRLEERWSKRQASLERRTKGQVCYAFGDVLA